MASGEGQQVNDDDVAKGLELTRYALMELNDVLARMSMEVPTASRVHADILICLEIVVETLGKTELAE